MNVRYFWIMFATASLMACGQSEDSAMPPPAQDLPQQASPAADPLPPASAEPASAEPAQPVVPAEPVAAPAETAPATQAKAVPVKPAEPAPAAKQPTAKPAPTSPAPKAAVAEPDSPPAPTPDLAHGQQIYRQACAFCHDKGVAGAPKTGDAAAWGPRLAQGMNALYATALGGKGAMPAKGGNPSLKDVDVKAAVDYIVAQSR